MLNLKPRRRRTLRNLIPFLVLSALLVWVVRIPPTIIFWLGVIMSPAFAILQVIAALLYLRLMPLCLRQMEQVGARGLSAYLQQQLQRAYHGVMDNSLLVLALSAVNVVVPLVLLFNAPLIPTTVWEALAFFAFGAALFTFVVAMESSLIIYDMFSLASRRDL
ncbi:MAG: hypothetical protein LC737_00915 [Chloroflexi bacterium]|nr:hypothetical protein [Chloroflexota bacterium]